jgi:hypothetical protein
MWTLLNEVPELIRQCGLCQKMTVPTPTARSALELQREVPAPSAFKNKTIKSVK